MPSGSFTRQIDLTGGNAHLNKVCPNGKCRYGPATRLNKTESATHTAILHGLDRKVGKLLFPREPFEPSVDMWVGKPMVFAQAHPEPKDATVLKNPPIFGIDRQFTKDELDRINGAIIGELDGAEIMGMGRSKLVVSENYTDETAIRMFGQGLITEEQLERSQAAIPIALKLAEENKLSHSSGFLCPDDGKQLTGTVNPNHVLKFEETAFDVPKDPMSVMLNKKEVDDVTESKKNIGKTISGKNEGRLKAAMDSIMAIFRDILPEDEPGTEAKTNQEIIATSGSMNTPDGESLEGRIENVRRALSEHIGLKWPDGTPQSVWAVMTMPDKIIWQHPNTSQYYATPYTIEGEGVVTFGQPEEVEQAYVVKEANTVIPDLTSEDLTVLSKRNNKTNKKEPETMAPTPEEIAAAAVQKQKDDALAAKDAQIAQLQKERDDLATEKAQVQKEKFDAAWGNLKKDIIPPAEVKDPADEVKLQKMSVEDPLGFAAKVASWKNAPKMGEEGSSHVSGPDGTKNETAEIDRILKASTGRSIPGSHRR